MSQQKTTPTDSDVGAFLAQVEGEARRADCSQLVALMSEIAGEGPVLWGPSIVGFGSYHYRYPTGHEGDAALIGFSPRKAEFSIYLMGVYFPESKDKAEALLARLGKHRMGKACLYVKRLSNIDEGVLRELMELSVREVRAHYG